MAENIWAGRSARSGVRWLVLIGLTALGACSSKGEQGGVVTPPQVETEKPVGLYFGANVGVTPSIVEALRAIAARDTSRDDRVFMKVGDSMTVNCSALCCFSAQDDHTIDLGDNQALAPTVSYFDEAALEDGSRSWNRHTLAARVGVTSDWPLTPAAGGTTPLAAEVGAINPRFAVVMLGTNDNAGADPTFYLGPRVLRAYAKNMLDLVATLEAEGIIPLLTYIPPVTNEARREVLTPAFDAVVRGVATAASVPTIDFYTDMAALGSDAFISDGVHPTVDPISGCILTSAGLGFGYNIRNLRTLQVLDKVRRTLINGEVAPDAEAPDLAGRGTAEAPLVVPALPFALELDMKRGAAAASDQIHDYSACGGQSGALDAEWILKLNVAQPTPARAIVVPPSGACDPGPDGYPSCSGSRDVMVALFVGSLVPAACADVDSTMVEHLLQPGRDYYIVVDGFPEGERADTAIITLHRCHPEDPACTAE